MNYEFIQKLGNEYLPGMNEEKLSSNGQFMLLQYRYIEQKDKSEITAADFRPLLKSLDFLRKESIEH